MLSPSESWNEYCVVEVDTGPLALEWWNDAMVAVSPFFRFICLMIYIYIYIIVFSLV